MARVLLVEDDLMNRDMLARRLKWEGHQVIMAADGAQAVSLAQTERPDVILMDLGLPIMNGWEATRQIKTVPATSSIPVIALTAFAMSEDRQKALAVGCDEFETKPVDFPRLLAKMRALLGQVS
jgi:CheY-like chemotaxis protein